MKIRPYGMPFIEALRLGYLGRIEDRKYLDWVKTLPCVCCGQTGVDPSHFNGMNLSGGATKSPDYFAIPLCRLHHDLLHHDKQYFEETYGDQSYWAMLTLLQAIIEGFFGERE